MGSRGIISTNFGAPRAIGRGTVEVVKDETLDQMTAVVDAGRHDEDAEHVLLGGHEAQLRAGAVDLRADVHGGAGLVRRDELGVKRDGRLDGVKEQLLGHDGARDKLGRALHAHRVPVGAEHRNLVIGRAEGLQALVGLLAVIQSGRHAVEPDVRVGDELEGRPFARLDRVVRFDVAIHFFRSTSIHPTCCLFEDCACSPSRTRKPTSAQSMVLTGGGGN